MDLKYSEVVTWLKGIYGNEKVPPFEKTAQSINLLHQLMITAKEAEENSKVLIEDYSRKTEEYSAQAQQMDQWHNKVGITKDELSKRGKDILEAYAQTSEILNVQKPAFCDVLLAFSKMEMEHLEACSEHQQEVERTATLQHLNQQLALKLNKVTSVKKQAEDSAEAEKKEIRQKKQQSKFLNEKCKNYEMDIGKLQGKLDHVNLKPEIMQLSVVAQKEKLDCLKKQIEDLEKKQATLILPPDVTQAQILVEGARQQHANLMRQISAVSDY
ncbi:HAUS augmin-like complex subunit 1 [Oratosquilla oratoria]|uniref:HAUS augmin-like complex subunit 1 n=1 Tax=Oratosquilla oratoria TaxID=337810 RepID=UPI003F768CC0